MYTIEEFDEQKSRIMKYLIYKKRTESEVRTKFSQSIDEELLDDIIEHLKEAGYIDDNNYIAKCINEFTALKDLSIKEVKYKLYTKGVDSHLVDDYIDEHIDELMEYEKKSAENLVRKKSSVLEEQDIRLYLLNKGYKKCSIDNAIEGEE